MKNIRKILSFILSLMLLFSMAACAASGTSDAPPKFEELASVICLPKEDALPKLNLSVSDLSEEKILAGYHTTGRTRKICGVDFDCQVMIWSPEDVDRLMRVQYMVILEDAKQAANTVLAIAAEITKAGGKAMTPVDSDEPEHFIDITAEKMEELVKSGKGRSDYWFLGHLTTEDAKAYMAYAAENSVSKPNASDPLSLMVHLNVIKAANEEKFVIFLDYFPEVSQKPYR